MPMFVVFKGIDVHQRFQVMHAQLTCQQDMVIDLHPSFLIQILLDLIELRLDTVALAVILPGSLTAASQIHA